jgi:hypothetical protein
VGHRPPHLAQRDHPMTQREYATARAWLVGFAFFAVTTAGS